VTVRLALPQPFEDLDHTTNINARMRGASPEEVLARLVLAQGALLAGGGAVAVAREERIAVAGGGDYAETAVALLRELLFRFATERVLPAACEVLRAGPDGAEAIIALARYDPEVHGEGTDLKAVTWHAARLETEGDGWVGQIVWDI
jgi:SHS2 domain-containing protein